MKPLTFSATRVELPSFTEGYATHYPEGREEIDYLAEVQKIPGVVLCEHCLDGGYCRSAEFSVYAFYCAFDGSTQHYTRLVCGWHFVAEAQNFHDLGV